MLSTSPPQLTAAPPQDGVITSAVRVKLSGVIISEYASRAVFMADDREWPHVPWDTLPSTGGIVTAPVGAVRAMLLDAEFNADRRRGPEYMPSGIRRAYQRLAEQLRAVLVEEGTASPKRTRR